MRKFLSCPFLLLLPLLFCSCGRISEQCLLIDSADTCRVTTDQKVTLIRNGLPHDYHMPSTKDFFNGQTLSSSDISADSSRIYVYRCGDKFAASRINIEHARALRNAVAAGKYSPADILPSCALWFLAAFVIGCAAYCCRATDKRIMITVGSTLAMLFLLPPAGKPRLLSRKEHSGKKKVHAFVLTTVGSSCRKAPISVTIGICSWGNAFMSIVTMTFILLPAKNSPRQLWHIRKRYRILPVCILSAGFAPWRSDIGHMPLRKKN